MSSSNTEKARMREVFARQPAAPGFERCGDDETGVEAEALALLDVERRRMQRRARPHATVTTGSARVIAI